MAPERSPKRQKTSLATESSNIPQTTPPNQTPPPPDGSTSNSTVSADLADVQSQRSSWYSSWSRKAAPAAEAAREGIKSAGSSASDVIAVMKDMTPKPRSVRSPSLAMTLGKGRASRASLADVTTTMIHAEVKKPSHTIAPVLPKEPTDLQINTKAEHKAADTTSKSSIDDKRTDASTSTEQTFTPTPQEPPGPRPGWLGWLAKTDGTGSESSKEPTVEMQPEQSEEAAAATGSPGNDAKTASSSKPEAEAVKADQTSRRSWLPTWNADTKTVELDIKEQPESLKSETPKQIPTAVQSGSPDTQARSMVIKEPQESKNQTGKMIEASSLPAVSQSNTKATGWAFWSREPPKDNDILPSVDQPREGEIAVAETPSQDRPRKTSISVPSVKEDIKLETKKPEMKKSEARKLTGTMDNVSTKVGDDISIKSEKKKEVTADLSTTKVESSNAKAIATDPVIDKKSTSTKPSRTEHNLLLPSLHETFRLPENPSLLSRLASLMYVTKEPEVRHLALARDPPRIRRALAIGVHGYFPTTLIRSVLGQPTGTSIKFADMAAKSIKRWAMASGHECEVKTAALEGEGKIAERIELLWRLLLNWIEEIRKSDFIMVACHSQGVPVAIMLVAKLIQFGCVSSTRICICAMAGVNMGPFQEYKSRWIGGSAGELFEFSDSSSRVSLDYLAALDAALKFGVRLTFVGSIDDQLVSLESSIFSPISHPHIFRAVSIDSRVHAPNFLSHLVGFALKLRNLGVQDHGLIRELSSPLAGSLYTGEGHSRIYEDDAVYDLAVAFALETTAITDVPLIRKSVVVGGSNPYILPFAMRGILEEDFVKTELQKEVTDLLQEFDQWKPMSKALKDVKFRLEGIRSRL